MRYDVTGSGDDSDCDVAADDAFPNCAVKIEVGATTAFHLVCVGLKFPSTN